MEKISEKEAIKLLRKYAKSEEDFRNVLKHSRAVKKVAVKIGKKIKGIDLDFIKSASLLHDIGRFKCAPDSKENVRHGVEGGHILRGEGLHEKYALVAERHLGAGISKGDIMGKGLDLPLEDYIPVSKEEKIICHADNLVFDQRVGGVEEATERFSKELGKKAGKKVRKLAEEVEGFF